MGFLYARTLRGVEAISRVLQSVRSFRIFIVIVYKSFINYLKKIVLSNPVIFTIVNWCFFFFYSFSLTPSKAKRAFTYLVILL
jgi:hypothetical protein